MYSTVHLMSIRYTLPQADINEFKFKIPLLLKIKFRFIPLFTSATKDEIRCLKMIKMIIIIIINDNNNSSNNYIIITMLELSRMWGCSTSKVKVLLVAFRALGSIPKKLTYFQEQLDVRTGVNAPIICPPWESVYS